MEKQNVSPDRHALKQETEKPAPKPDVSQELEEAIKHLIHRLRELGPLPDPR